MTFTPGEYTLGPEHGTLSVQTTRGGAAAKAGHDLLIEVSAWEGMLKLAEDPAASSVTLTADARSMHVRDGTGGMTKLDEDDKAGIAKTIHEDILKGTTIAFESSGVRPTDSRTAGQRFEVDGELELFGRRAPVSFTLTIDDDGRLVALAKLKQTAFGIKPYSALFGTLKVADEVQVAVDAQLPAT
jgi:polyisoprenoid-binding protein YceI